MKIENIRNYSNSNVKRQNFNGLGAKAVDGMVKVQDSILKAGFAATFVAQDFLGSELPRILTGLTRNSDKTGELNYKFASMEACRELLTGPPIFALPFAAFALAQKGFGGTIKSPVQVIESFSDKLNNVYNVGITQLETADQFKKAFYGSAWNDALANTCGSKYKPKKKLLDKVTDLMTELESSRNYSISDRIHKAKFRTTNDITNEITTLITDELKSNADAKASFSRVVYKDGIGKKAQSSVKDFVGHMSRFTKDAFKGISSDLKSISADDITSKIKAFRSRKIGNRIIANFGILAAAILYATQVPKIYKSLNKTNPGLIGLTDEAQKETLVAVNKPVDYEAFSKLKKAENKPAFKGLLSNLVQKEGKLRSVANAFEFNGGDMACASLLSVLTFGIVRPRVKNAYDEHDYREILTRDITTLTALVCGAKALLKNIARFAEKATGLSLTEKGENFFKQSKLKQAFDHMRPFGGVQVLSNSDIIMKYSDIEKYKGGVAGFCEYVSKTGGNLAKLFANDKTTKTNVEKMIKKDIAKATDKEIIAAIKNKKNAELVKNIAEVFKDTNNAFVKKAKSITGVFGFVSTFIAIPAFMIFLQKLNEKITKNAIAKEQQVKKIAEQKFTAIKLTSDMLQPDASKLNIK